MNTSTSNINVTLDKISSAAAAAKRAGIQINTTFNGDLFQCVAFGQNINRTIDLNEQKANLKLNALLKHIYCVIPADQAMKSTH